MSNREDRHWATDYINNYFMVLRSVKKEKNSAQWEQQMDGVGLSTVKEAFSEEGWHLNSDQGWLELPGQVGAEGHSRGNGMSRDMDSGGAGHFGGVQRRPEGQKHWEQGQRQREFAEAGSSHAEPWGIIPGDLGSLWSPLDQGSDHMQVITDHCRGRGSCRKLVQVREAGA